MWGRYVEGELERAQKGSNNEKQALAKIQMRFKTLMQDPEEVEDEHKDFPKHLHREPAPTAFRDPMKLLGKKG